MPAMPDAQTYRAALKIGGDGRHESRACLMALAKFWIAEAEKLDHRAATAEPLRREQRSSDARSP